MKTTLPLLLLLFASFAACDSAEERAAENAEDIPPVVAVPTDEPVPDGLDQITGLLQTSGLQPEEAEALGLTGGRYQLISQVSYFLEGHDSLQAYLGQCMTFTGKQLVPDAEGENLLTVYNHQLFKVEEASSRLYSYCYYSDTTSAQPQGREVTYTGQVERMRRPAPDIAYDYQLRLQTPYRDPNHPINPGQLVQTLPLQPADFEVLSTLEGAVRHNIMLQLQGIQHQGYAEQEAVWVLAADSLSL